MASPICWGCWATAVIFAGFVIAGATDLEVFPDRILAPALDEVRFACVASSSTAVKMEWRKLHTGVKEFTSAELHRLTKSDMDALNKQSDLLSKQPFHPTYNGRKVTQGMTYQISQMGETDSGQYVCALVLSQSHALVRVIDVIMKKEQRNMGSTPTFDLTTSPHHHTLVQDSGKAETTSKPDILQSDGSPVAMATRP